RGRVRSGGPGDREEADDGTNGRGAVCGDGDGDIRGDGGAGGHALSRHLAAVGTAAGLFWWRACAGAAAGDPSGDGGAGGIVPALAGARRPAATERSAGAGLGVGGGGGGAAAMEHGRARRELAGAGGAADPPPVQR